MASTNVSTTRSNPTSPQKKNNQSLPCAQTASSSTHSSASSVQIESRQGSRKRKQNMQSSATDTAASQMPEAQMVSVNTDKSIAASIRTVIEFGIPENVAVSCAKNMREDGRLVNATTLYEECELLCPDEIPGNSFNFQNTISSNSASLSEPEYVETSSSHSYIHNVLENPSVSSFNSAQPSPSHQLSQNTSSTSAYYKFSSGSSSQQQSSSRSTNNKRSSSTSRESNKYNSSLLPFSLAVGEDCVDGGLARKEDESDDDGLEQWTVRGSVLNESPSVSVSVTETNTKTYSSSMQHGLLSDTPKHNHLSFTEGPSIDVKDSANIDANRGSNVTYNAEVQTTAQNKTQTGSDIVHEARHTVQDKGYLQTCIKLVQKEFALLEKSRICSLCSVKPRDVTFLPCGHFTACRSCAEPIFVCPSCHKTIVATVDTYLS